MNLPFVVDKTFQGIDHSTNELPKAEYDNCTFIDCTFSNSYISNIVFIECEFIDCNLSLAKSKQTSFQKVNFSNCKLVGFPFDTCNDFLLSVGFNKCNLNLASFYGLTIKSTLFTDCNLQKTDFTETDLTKSTFKNCDLKRAIFDNSILENVDFRTAYNLVIDPEKNRIKQSRFSRINVTGLLIKYNIKIG